MKNLVKQCVAFALVATLAISGAFASVYKTAVKVQPANVYTYYLDIDCDTPVQCSTEIIDGVLCSESFQGLTVYDAPGCVGGHETTNILGKRQP
ncbi:hypothetical protein ABIE26_003944 [Pedobacter africanus]|uniref:Uncharacterized protein n=1 Tax=Pedobacter africanus TaxID=151894 RepID=A0ACC6L0T8_9SPHI|nr:hypothetical protein [Pedobacter africanus]MDR6785245.1 hypothetical protein [Pedobacter africanus]